MSIVNTAGDQRTAFCLERLGNHRHKSVHSASRLGNHAALKSHQLAKLFIVPPVYSARLAAFQRLESTRSERISHGPVTGVQGKLPPSQQEQKDASRPTHAR